MDINLLKANITDNINLEDTCLVKFFLSFAFQKAYVFEGRENVFNILRSKQELASQLHRCQKYVLI
jgi:hypothetical protein